MLTPEDIASILDKSDTPPKTTGNILTAKDVTLSDGDSDMEKKFRANGYNTPEREHKGRVDAHPDAELSKEYIQSILDEGGTIVQSGEKDFYKRNLSTVRNKQGQDIAPDMVASGMAWADRTEASGQQEMAGIASAALGYDRTGNKDLNDATARKSKAKFDPFVNATPGDNISDRRGTFHRAWDRGNDQAKESMGGLVNYLGDVFDNKDWQEDGKWIARSANVDAALNPRKVEDWTQAGTLDKKLDYFVETVGEMAPMLMVDLGITAATGGVGGAQAIVRRAGVEALKRGVKRGILSGEAMSGFAQSAGAVNARLEAEGIDSTWAPLASGAVGAVANTLPTAIVLPSMFKALGIEEKVAGEVAEQVNKSIASRFTNSLKTTATGSLAEGSTEMVQGIMDELIYTTAADKEWDYTTVQAIDDMLRGVVGGAAVTGAASTASHAVGAMMDYNEARSGLDANGAMKTQDGFEANADGTERTKTTETEEVTTEAGDRVTDAHRKRLDWAIGKGTPTVGNEAEYWGNSRKESGDLYNNDQANEYNDDNDKSAVRKRKDIADLNASDYERVGKMVMQDDGKPIPLAELEKLIKTNQVTEEEVVRFLADSQETKADVYGGFDQPLADSLLMEAYNRTSDAIRNGDVSPSDSAMELFRQAKADGFRVGDVRAALKSVSPAILAVVNKNARTYDVGKMWTNFRQAPVAEANSKRTDKVAPNPNATVSGGKAKSGATFAVNPERKLDEIANKREILSLKRTDEAKAKSKQKAVTADPSKLKKVVPVEVKAEKAMASTQQKKEKLAAIAKGVPEGDGKVTSTALSNALADAGMQSSDRREAEEALTQIDNIEKAKSLHQLFAHGGEHIEGTYRSIRKAYKGKPDALIRYIETERRRIVDKILNDALQTKVRVEDKDGDLLRNMDRLGRAYKDKRLVEAARLIRKYKGATEYEHIMAVNKVRSEAIERMAEYEKDESGGIESDDNDVSENILQMPTWDEDGNQMGTSDVHEIMDDDSSFTIIGHEKNSREAKANKEGFLHKTSDMISQLVNTGITNSTNAGRFFEFLSSTITGEKSSWNKEATGSHPVLIAPHGKTGLKPSSTPVVVKRTRGEQRRVERLRKRRIEAGEPEVLTPEKLPRGVRPDDSKKTSAPDSDRNLSRSVQQDSVVNGRPNKVLQKDSVLKLTKLIENNQFYDAMVHLYELGVFVPWNAIGRIPKHNAEVRLHMLSKHAEYLLRHGKISQNETIDMGRGGRYVLSDLAKFSLGEDGVEIDSYSQERHLPKAYITIEKALWDGVSAILSAFPDTVGNDGKIVRGASVDFQKLDPNLVIYSDPAHVNPRLRKVTIKDLQAYRRKTTPVRHSHQDKQKSLYEDVGKGYGSGGSDYMDPDDLRSQEKLDRDEETRLEIKQDNEIERVQGEGQNVGLDSVAGRLAERISRINTVIKGVKAELAKAKDDQRERLQNSLNRLEARAKKMREERQAYKEELEADGIDIDGDADNKVISALPKAPSAPQDQARRSKLDDINGPESITRSEPEKAIEKYRQHIVALQTRMDAIAREQGALYAPEEYHVLASEVALTKMVIADLQQGQKKVYAQEMRGLPKTENKATPEEKKALKDAATKKADDAERASLAAAKERITDDTVVIRAIEGDPMAERILADMLQKPRPKTKDPRRIALTRKTIKTVQRRRAAAKKGFFRLLEMVHTRLERIHPEIASRIRKVLMDSSVMSEKFIGDVGNIMGLRSEQQRAYDDIAAGRDTPAATKFKEWMASVDARIKEFDPDHKADAGALISLNMAAIEKNRAGFLAVLKRAGLKEPEMFVEQLLDGGGRPEWSTTVAPNSANRFYLKQLEPVLSDLRDAGYTDNDFTRSMVRYSHAAAKWAAWNKHMSEDGKKNAVYDRLSGEVNPANATEFNKLMMGAMGKLGHDMAPWARSFNSVVLAFHTATILLFSAVSSIPEFVGVIARSRSTVDGLGTDFKKILTGMGRNELRAYAKDHDIIVGEAMESAINNLYGLNDMTVGRWSQKVSSAVFKWNGQMWLTELNRALAASAARRFLEHHAGQDNVTSKRMLAELQIDAATVKAYLVSGKKDSIEGRAYRDALHRFVNESVTNPRNDQVPLIATDPRYALVTSLKKFFYGFYDNVHKSMYRDAKASNAEGSGMSRAMTTMLIAGITVLPMAALSEILRELIKYPMGRPAGRERELSDIVTGTLMQTGGLGPLSLAYNAIEMSQYGRNPGIVLAGPTVSLLADAISGKLQPNRFVPIASQQPDLGRMVNEGVKKLTE